MESAIESCGNVALTSAVYVVFYVLGCCALLAPALLSVNLASHFHLPTPLPESKR